MKRIGEFVSAQLSRWPLACENFRALKQVRVKSLSAGGLDVKVQFNPARIISSAARTDAASLKERPCFLCPENRPAEQVHIRFDGRKGKKYDILVNPYPIFPDHLVIAYAGHSAQSIWKRYVDMLDLARAYQDYIFFYNGPRCGASAPDHHHFQGAGRGRMPLENDVDAALDALRGKSVPSGKEDCALEYLASVLDADLFHYRKFVRGVFVLRARTAKSAAKLFYRLLDCAPVPEGDSEPRFNLFTYYKAGEYRSIIVFRACHRSHHYFSDGPDHLTMSPGCVDMCGVFITPVIEDFEKLDNGLLEEMLDEITVSRETEDLIVSRLTRKQPVVEVGIMSGKEIEFEIISDGAGPRKAVLQEGKIGYDGALYDELDFGAVTPSTLFAEPTFILYGVTIGKGFHWQKKENQRFAGALKIIAGKDGLTAVNVIGVEDYLVSVISSEMKSTASLEFLKAHAVISRSWVMARIMDKRNPVAGSLSRTGRMPDHVDNLPSLVTWLDGRAVRQDPAKCPESDGKSGREYEIMKWYGHTAHRNFDVCADDHCQRYQGLTRASGKNVRDAVDLTWGEVLVYGEGQYGGDAADSLSGMEICDARFSKCCGGVTERFSTCWEDRDYDYLPSLPDTPRTDASGSAGERDAQRPFCDTEDREILSQVLNDYDLGTRDFYRWEVRYTRDGLSELVRRRSGIDIGRISSVEPLERGGSGRIRKLRLIGSEGSLVIGKELEIRRILSESHLKSSAFEVEYLDASGKVVQGILGSGRPVSATAGGDARPEEGGSAAEWTEVVLHGRGWGHGVGLCQIGAAVMASQGYTYRQILEHYYPGTVILNGSSLSS